MYANKRLFPIFTKVKIFKDMAGKISVKRFWRISPLVRENLRVALRSIKNNRLRSALTILIVAIGITSLVGILTATDSLKSEVSSSFEKLGASSFTISQQYFGGSSIKSGRIRNNSNITYFQAEEFKRQYDIPAFVSVYNYAEAKTVKRGSLSTSPRVELYGADEDYVPYSNAQIAEGRNFSQQDIKGAAFVCLLGSGVVSTVFKPGEHAVGQSVDLEGVKYRVIGLLASKGQGFGGGGADQSIIVPVTNARSYFFGDNASYEIGVQPRIALEDMSPVPYGSVVPTIKIATNHLLAEKKPSWIDFDGEKCLDEGFEKAKDELLDLVIQVASGLETKEETHDMAQIALFK